MKVLIRPLTVERPVENRIEIKTRSVGADDTKRDFLACFALIVLISAIFYKTVLFQMPISRIALVAEWDSLFAALRTGVSLPIDPSAVLLALPTYTTIAAQYHAGQLPLWNHLNAFGSPLLGDIQATVFSPLRILFNIFPTMQVYNWQLVAQVQIAAVFAYLLSRRLKATLLPSLLCAIAYACCPFVLWYLELQSGVGFAFNPFVLWLFTRAAQVRTNKSALLAGFGAGCTILMGHPETSFFAIVFACLAMFVLLYDAPLCAARILVLSAAAAFATCAPSFIPFVEYARNSDCYKYAVGESAFMAWTAIVANLCTPLARGASPFLGVLTPAFAVSAIFSKHRRELVACSILALTTFIISAKLWPFSMVSAMPPFNYLITVYALPLFLLSVCLLSALGLTAIFHTITAPAANPASKQSVFVFAMAAMCIVAITPFAMQYNANFVAETQFDLTLGAPGIYVTAVKRDAVLALIAMVALSVLFMANREKAKFLCAASIVAFGTISVVCAAKRALPNQPTFQRPPIAALETIKNSGERFLAVGTHLAKPDVNLLYGIEDVRSINAMLPPRYLSFTKACGASADQFTQYFGPELTSLIDVASVRYILSQVPVTSAGATAPGLQLDTDPINLAVIGRCKLDLTALSDLDPNKLRLGLCLLNPKGQLVWFGDRGPIPSDGIIEVRVPLPSANVDGFRLRAQLFDAVSGDFVYDAQRRERSIDLGAVPPPANTDRQSHFRLDRLFPDGIRLYVNHHAAPRAYFASRIIAAKSAEEALALLQSKDFRTACDVVLENPPASLLPASTVPTTPAVVRLIARKPAEVEMEYSSERDGVLVLSDTYYPGWKAFIDGEKVPVLRANYLFRGILAPAGHHKVTMRYYPGSFTVGILCFVGFWSIALVFVLRRRKSKLGRR